jgi:hypothetical protein
METVEAEADLAASAAEAPAAEEQVEIFEELGM